MGLQFIFGPSGSGKSHLLYEEVSKQALENPKKNFLIIVPDQFTMQTQKDLVEFNSRKGILNIDVLSFGRLSHRIFDETGGNQKPVLDDTGKSLVLRKVAADVSQELLVLGKNLHKQGYIHEVKSAISEFMQYGIGAQELEELIEGSTRRGALQYKLKDLQVLYRNFSSYIQEKFVTTEETLDQLCEALLKSRLVKGSVVCFDGFTGFTPIQNRVILRLCELAQKVVITLVIDEKEDPYRVTGEQKLFYLTSKTVTSLSRLADLADINREKDIFLMKRPVKRYEKKKELAHLEEFLFRFPSKPYEGECREIAIYEASTPREEVRQTCLKITDLIREKGYHYRDIAVVTGDMEAYEQEIRMLFSRFKIPCFIDQTRGILLNPFVEYIRAALQMMQKNFSYETVFHYLRSGMADFTREEVDIFENYVVSLGIRGKKRYQEPFVRKSPDMTDAAKELEQMNVLRERILFQVEDLS